MPIMVAQCAQQTARRKAIYEELYPGSKKGAAQALGTNRKLGHDVSEKSSLTSFASQTAEATGRNKRTIEIDAMRGEARE